MKRLYGIVGAGLVATSSCAVAFPYQFYRINLEDKVLVASKPEDDKPLDYCAFKDGEFKCMAVSINDYVNLKSDYKTKTERLIILEKRCGGNQ